MTSVLQLLDDIPSGGTADPASGWFARIEDSLYRNPHEWSSAIGRIGQLSDEHAWSLLAWTEVASSQVVRTRSRKDLVTAAFAVVLALQSGLDRRDCALVASLVRRASVLAGLNFAAAVAEASTLAGFREQGSLEVLAYVPARTPSTHSEFGAGATFAFIRKPPAFDVDDLERWLEGEDP